jgi:tetratricopeptide (TPR) repeat protein
MGFAKCQDLFDQSDDAIGNLEIAMAKAKTEHTVKLVSSELISIYRKLAEKYEIEAKEFDDNVQAALNYYEKCLVVCEKAGQQELQGQISHKIGKIYYNHKMYEKGIEHQTTFLQLAQSLQDVKNLTNSRLKKLSNIKWKRMRPLPNATWESMIMKWR